MSTQSTETDTSEPPKNKKWRSHWERYGITPLAILMSELTDGQVRAYSYFDGIQGKSGRPAKGVNACAAAIHQAPSAFLNNVRELEAVGLVRQIPHLTEGGGHGMTEFEVICNPVRNRGHSSEVRLPANTGQDGTPRGGRKCKAMNPTERKAMGSFRVGGTPAVQMPATQSRSAQWGRAATRTGVSAAPSVRALGSTNSGVGDQFSAFDREAELGCSQVVREVIGGEDGVGGSDDSGAFDSEHLSFGILCKKCGKPTAGAEFGDNCRCDF
jgi:hypothetical protein